MAAIDWAKASNGSTLTTSMVGPAVFQDHVTTWLPANLTDAGVGTRCWLVGSEGIGSSGLFRWIVTFSGVRWIDTLSVKYSRISTSTNTHGQFDLILQRDGLDVYRKTLSVGSSEPAAPLTYEESLSPARFADTVILEDKVSGSALASLNYIHQGSSFFDVIAEGVDTVAGVRIWDGAADIVLVAEPARDIETLSVPDSLRFYNGSAVVNLPLVGTSDPAASPIRICIDNAGTVKSLRKENV